jgi:sigma-B regulation protein RsbU (phosphoserine phosphatase)
MVAVDFVLAVPEPLPSWVKEMLRADGPVLAFSVILAAVGLSSLVLYFFPRKTRDPILISFGLFTLLYATQLLAETPTIRFVIDLPSPLWSHMTFALAYVIPVPFLVFFLHTIGQGWHRLALWAFRVQIGLAILAIAVDLVLADPGKMAFGNHILGIFAFLAFLFLLFAPGQPSTPELRLFRVGFTVFAVLGIQTALASAGIMRGPTHLEPIGLFVFVSCLGMVVARRMFTNQERLGALREELEIARQIQLAILPAEVPRIPGFEVATRYLPSSTVAGDFYDFLPAGDGCVGILIADVSGHGVPAALLASMVKVAIGTQAHHAADPAEVLSGLNRTLFGKLHEQFVTASYLFLDIPARRALYSSAGHPALLLRRGKERRVIEYNETGLILGISPETQYSNTVFSLEPQDRLVLYTDGIPEAMNKRGEHFGGQRLKQSIEDDAGLSPGRFCDSLLETLGAWAGTSAEQPHADDVTLVVMDFEPAGGIPEAPGAKLQ